MTEGPQVARLRAAASGDHELIAIAYTQWMAGATMLSAVSGALKLHAPNIESQMGQTGKQAAKAFHTVAGHVEEHSSKMTAAHGALVNAATALSSAQALLKQFDAAPLTEPQQPTTSPGSNHPEDVAAQKEYHSQKASYDAAYADRETKAAAAVDHMDTVYSHSTTTMEQVHGKSDPLPPTSGGSTAGAGGSTPTRSSTTGGYTPGTGAHSHSTSTTHTSTTSGGGGPVPTYTAHHPHGDPGSVPGYNPNDPGGNAEGGTPITPGGPGAGVPIGGASPSTSGGGLNGSTAGGLAGVVGGGALGGMTGISGAVRGPMAVPTGGISGGGSSASAGVRPIGTTSRSGVSGTLGRGGLVSEETVGTTSGSRGAATAGARGGAGAGSSTTRGGSGARGTAGSRGAGGRGTGGAQGRRGKKDPRKKDTDFFLEEQDWVEDEGAAPGVLD